MKNTKGASHRVYVSEENIRGCLTEYSVHVSEEHIRGLFIEYMYLKNT